MLSVECVDSACWVILNKRRLHQACYCASLFPSGNQYQLVIYELVDNPSADNPLLEIGSEVYSTFFWAADAESCANNIVHDFAHCTNASYPIELVNFYGGTIAGTAPLFAPILEVH